MPKAPKRDAAYFERRLINEFPAAYADLLAGRYSSITSACKAVGLMSSDTPLKALKRNWMNANDAERRQFDAWIRAGSPAVAVAAVPVTSSMPAVVGGYVESWAADRIRKIIHLRNMSKSDVMDELGYPRLNASLWNAIRSTGRRPALKDPKLIAAVEKWLADNRRVGP